MAMAHGLPFLVILRDSPLIMPAMVTLEPSGRVSSAISWAIEQSEALASTCSMPNSGWSLT